jgi:uncharacterized protein (TIGR02145 family)
MTEDQRDNLKRKTNMKLKLALFAITLLLAACTPTNENPWNAETVCPESGRGTFTDDRDGKEYQYTTIGAQVWMAENLNYKATNSLCYDNDPKNCDIYGRLYHFSDSNALQTSTVCPQGWHIPTDTEWSELMEIVGGGVKELTGSGGNKEASARLRTKEGWYKPESGTNVLVPDESGTNVCGFSALPGGRAGLNSGFDFIKTSARWWASTMSTTVSAKIYITDRIGNSTYGANVTTSSWAANSIRCVKD